MDMSATSSPLVVGLVQLTEPMLSFSNLPYAIGLLQSYAQVHAAHPERYLFLAPFFERLPFKEAVASLSLAQIVGISTYVWNEQYSLALARELKAARPEVLIVMGGPQVPDRAEAFLREHPWVDLVCHGEGERVFLQLLEAWPQNDWTEIPGLSWLDAEGRFQHHPPAPRLKDLDQIPSPFLRGYFDPLLESHHRRGSRQRWITAWETNRGCPFSCAFCDWGSATASKINRFGLERIRAELEWFGRQQIELVFCCDANFGILPRDLEIAQMAAQSKARYGYPKLLYTQSSKNATERVYDIQKLLLEAGLNTTVTLALQSLSREALKAIRRENISLQTFEELQYRFRRDAVPTYTDVLIGLPDETFESFRQGLGTIIAQGQHLELRTWPVFVLPNAALADPDYRREYGIESVFIPYVTSFQEVAEPLEGIWERHEMVVATRTMSRQDWARMSHLTWLTQCLYYSKALQIPLMLLYEVAGIPYQDSLLALLEDPLPATAEVLPRLRTYFQQRSDEMLAGQAEYVPGVDPRNGKTVWMNTEYFALIHLVQSPRLDELYQEFRQVLTGLLQRQRSHLPPGALDEALKLGRALLTQPLQETYSLELNYDLWGFYQQVITGAKPRLSYFPHRLVRARQEEGRYTLRQEALGAEASADPSFPS